MKNEKQVKRNYSEKFKLDAVLMVSDKGQSIAEVAKKLGVSYKSLCRWKAEFNKTPALHDNAMKLELKKLREGFKHLETECKRFIKETAALEKLAKDYDE